MTSIEYALTMSGAIVAAKERHEEAAREFLTVQDTPERVQIARDFNREYDIAPWAFDGE